MIHRQDLDALPAHGALGVKHAPRIGQEFPRTGSSVEQRIALDHLAESDGTRDDPPGKEPAALVRQVRDRLGEHRFEQGAWHLKPEWN
jgi:hypothetical protein